MIGAGNGSKLDLVDYVYESAEVKHRRETQVQSQEEQIAIGMALAAAFAQAKEQGK